MDLETRLLLCSLRRKSGNCECINRLLHQSERVMSRIRSNIYTSGFYDIYNSKDGKVRINKMILEGYGEYIVKLYNRMFTDDPPPIADIEKVVSSLLR